MDKADGPKPNERRNTCRAVTTIVFNHNPNQPLGLESWKKMGRSWQREGELKGHIARSCIGSSARGNCPIWWTNQSPMIASASSGKVGQLIQPAKYPMIFECQLIHDSESGSRHQKERTILEFFNGENLELDSVVEISDDVAKSLTRISTTIPTISAQFHFTSWPADFSESVAEHFGSMAQHTLVCRENCRYPDGVNYLEPISGMAAQNYRSLVRSATGIRTWVSWTSGCLRKYLPDSVINSKRMGGWLNQKKRYRSDDLRGVFDLPAAELLANGGATKIHLLTETSGQCRGGWKYKGELSIAIDRITPFAARCLAKRKYRKKVIGNYGCI